MAIQSTLASVLAQGQDFQAFMDDAALTFDVPLWQSEGFATPQYSMERTWRGILSVAESVPAASVIDFSGDKPIKRRPAVSELAGMIPTIGDKLQMDKEQVRQFFEFQDKVASGKIAGLDELQLLDFLWPDLKIAVTAPHQRLDYMMLETLSTGTTTMSKTNNPQGITWTALDWGVDVKFVGTVWSNTACTPITDINNVVKYWRALGVEMRYMLMNWTTFYNLVGSTQFTTKFTTTVQQAGKSVAEVGGSVLGLADVNAIFIAKGLPEIKIINKPINIESTAGVYTSATAFADHRVTFVPDLNLGKIVHTYANMQRLQDASRMYSVNNLTAIARWVDGDNEFTEYELNAIFVLNKAKQMSILKTDATS